MYDIKISTSIETENMNKSDKTMTDLHKSNDISHMLWRISLMLEDIVRIMLICYSIQASHKEAEQTFH